jgi:hypothetical protein
MADFQLFLISSIIKYVLDYLIIVIFIFSQSFKTSLLIFIAHLKHIIFIVLILYLLDSLLINFI